MKSQHFKYAEVITEEDEQLADLLATNWDDGCMLAELAALIGGYRERWSGALKRDGSKEQP